MTKNNQELNLETLDKASGGRNYFPGHMPPAEMAALLKMVHVSVPKFLSLAVMRPWFK